MQRFATFALAGAFSAALLSAGCQTDRDTSSSSRTSTTRSSSSSGYGADDKDSQKTSRGDSRNDDADGNATTAAQSDSNRGNRGQGQGRNGRNAHATIEPSKAPGQDDVKGTVTFMAAENGVKVHAEITGLEPNSKHGFHIHEKADLSDPELKSAGAHFNPAMHKHGGPGAGERHAGDLGNLEADAQGKATYDATVEGLTLDDSKTGIIGKSVIVHAKADDLKTDPSGDSGARIAGGVIERGRGGQGGQRGQQRGDRTRGEQAGQTQK